VVVGMGRRVRRANGEVRGVVECVSGRRSVREGTVVRGSRIVAGEDCVVWRGKWESRRLMIRLVSA